MLNKKTLLAIVLLFMAALLVNPANCLAGKIPATGDIFPAEELKMPEGEEHLKYLGLDPTKETFKLRDIKADFALVQIFSMYCPVCQRGAPEFNEVYRLIMESEAADKIKVVGIAPGNSAFEVSVFRGQYNILFPLIPDADFEWHKIMGEVGTPYYLLVNLRDGMILEDNLGPFGTAQEFFEIIMQHVK